MYVRYPLSLRNVEDLLPTTRCHGWPSAAAHVRLPIFSTASGACGTRWSISSIPMGTTAGSIRLNGESIWNDFLGVLSETTNPHLIHYGGYETTFLKRMCDGAYVKSRRSAHRAKSDMYVLTS